jgi:hypothetical protein
MPPATNRKPARSSPPGGTGPTGAGPRGTQRTERIRPTVTAPSTVATPAAVNSTG